MSQNPQPRSVVIDGITYAPVTRPEPSAFALGDVAARRWAASISIRWVDMTCPENPGHLRLIVTDEYSGKAGETVAEFLSRLIQGLPG